MFSRSLAIGGAAHRHLVGLAVASAIVVCVPSLASARVVVTAAGTGSSTSEYENQLQSAATTNGDIWGGEQSTSPATGRLRPDAPVITSVRASSALPTRTPLWARAWAWMSSWSSFLRR